MSFDLVIFDCDGVLVDSESIINRAHARRLSACGYAITEQELVARFCGMSDSEMLEIIEHERNRPLPAAYAGQVEAIIEREFQHSLASIPGVRDVLDALPAPVCVASSSTPGQLRRKLELTGLLGRFGDRRFSAAMVARGKPAPDLFLHAAAEMGATSDRCVVIEDSPAGITAARAADMVAIGFCGGSHCQPGHEIALRDCGAALVIADMRQLPGVISRISG
jgi:HAD superfamily hydrolase (TIGR01509 family)